MTTQPIDLGEELARFRRASNESIQLAREFGVVVDMAKWLTVKRYAEKYSVSTQVVTNWIARDIIPADCVMDLPELNNIRLVKDQPYR